jgi:hypothetical protein
MGQRPEIVASIDHKKVRDRGKGKLPMLPFWKEMRSEECRRIWGEGRTVFSRRGKRGPKRGGLVFPRKELPDFVPTTGEGGLRPDRNKLPFWKEKRLEDCHRIWKDRRMCVLDKALLTMRV